LKKIEDGFFGYEGNGNVDVTSSMEKGGKGTGREGKRGPGRRKGMVKRLS